MFQIQMPVNLGDAARREKLDKSRHDEVYRYIVWCLKNSPAVCRDIAKSKRFPLTLWRTCVRGISYELETSDLKGLYAVLKQDASAVVPAGACPQQVEADFFAVCRLLRQACKA